MVSLCVVMFLSNVKSRISGMDEGERIAFVEALAEFHASTHYLMSEHSEGKEGYLNDFEDLRCIKDFDATTEGMMKGSIHQGMGTLEAIARELLDDKIANKISAFEPHAYERWYEGFIKPYGHFQTIIHGDAWINNAMFRYRLIHFPLS